ncbi:MAG: T9SS type A sorting domain-containing protein [Bacteroidota bacterium]
MKKYLFTLGAFCCMLYAQSQNTNQFTLNQSNIGTIAPNSVRPNNPTILNNVNANTSYWIEPIGDIMTNKGIDLTSSNPNQKFYLSTIFQDSTVRIGNGTSTTNYVNSIFVGNVLDPKSQLLQSSFTPIVTNSDPYIIDSLYILGSYVKKTSAVDTLYTWIVWGDTANTSVFNKITTGTAWISPISSWRYSILGPKVSGAGSNPGNTITSTAPASNKLLIKYVLQTSDSVSSVGTGKYIAVKLVNSLGVSNPITIPAGNIVSCFYTFVPGYSYNSGDCVYSFSGATVQQNKNGFSAFVWEQNNPAISSVNDLADHQVDPTSFCMSTSYTKRQRHNTTGSASSTALTGNLLSAPVILYHLNVTTAGLTEYDKANFKLEQNYPNPTSDNTTVKYNLSKNAKTVTFVLTDVYGKVIMEENLMSNMGSHEVKIAAPARGIYFYTLKVDGISKTRKMIIE